MTPAESMKDEGPPLTAADLDRLAHEWSERRVVTNSVEHREKADRARLERLKTTLPSLLALARRGLEAEAKLAALDDGTAPPEELSAYGAGLEIGKRSVERKLAAALAEVERVRGRLEKALLAIRLGFHTERFVVGDEGVTRYSCCGKEYVCADPFVNDHERDCKAVQLVRAAEAQAAKVELKPHRAECEGGENCICQRRPRAQAGQAAKQGGEGKA